MWPVDWLSYWPGCLRQDALLFGPWEFSCCVQPTAKRTFGCSVCWPAIGTVAMTGGHWKLTMAGDVVLYLWVGGQQIDYTCIHIVSADNTIVTAGAVVQNPCPLPLCLPPCPQYPIT